jgi:hypothetical protein
MSEKIQPSHIEGDAYVYIRSLSRGARLGHCVAAAPDWDDAACLAVENDGEK